MEWLNTVTLTNLITPAILISLLVFMVKFFGRAVSDQKPFTDDRKWEADISGVFFLVNRVLIPIVIVMMYVEKIAYFWPLNVFWDNLRNFKNPFIVNDLYLFIFFVIYFVVFAVFSSRLLSFAEIKTERNAKINWNIFYKEITINFFIGLIPIAIIVFLYVVYLTKDLVYFAYSLLLSFVSFFGLAAVESLVKKNIVRANIYFVDSKIAPIKGCRVVRENSDNVRVIDNKKELIINKSQIFKVEKISNNALAIDSKNKKINQGKRK
jgi:hypothetical protein